jgi:hypothetical protein
MRTCLGLLLMVFVFSVAALAQPAQISSGPSVQSSNRSNSAHQNRSFFPFKAKRTKDQEKKLRPSAEDLARFSDFLKQPRTGIFRLVNDIDCESNMFVIRVDDACKNTIPGGSFYSFREKGYTTSYLADLRLKQGIFVSDGVLSQNILVKLGDVALEGLSAESAGLKYLNEFEPETRSTEATRQFIQIVRGVWRGNYEYRKALPSAENTTYGLRLIAYRGSIYRSFRGWVYNLLDGDDRVDLIVALRVVQKDPDGSVTILWRELSRKKSPKLEYERKRKPAPITLDPNRAIAE